ncbi:MAG: GTP 3',8-cyclase MoaA [Bacteroidetes bacterium]|nr:GTP 3',8-cyclase MoaA [Bacteroidota bacterium]
MYDSFNRKITYLRISVTDRCNLRCRYCMPEEGVKPLPHDEILSFEEILEVARFAVAHGVNKIRITGGEPLVRKEIVALVAQLAKLTGLKDFGMTTNGILLPKFAQQLADAGLKRVNISLDTVDPERFKWITRLGSVEAVFKGIEAAREAGLTPIKLNCVIKNNHDEPDAQAVKAFADANGLQIRFIKEMNLETGQFSVVEGGDGGHCASCNRMRLTANGDLKPCLFTDLSYNVRALGVEEAYLQAIQNKPACGSINQMNQFSNIGG